jgi:3'-5' exoribonuclease
MYAQMLQIFRDLPNPWVRGLGVALLEDPEIQSRYRKCPAAKTIHHAFVGGLLCHSLQIIRLADAVLPLYKGINRDLVVFGAAFHDFGKIFELSYDGSFGYTDEGRLVGHIAIGVTLIDRKIRLMPGFPEDLEWQLKHLVLSHHGRLEYGSPKRPHTLEAQLVHHLDDMDSKINSIQTFIASENSGSRWTGHHKAYDQYYYRGEPAT